MKLLVNQTRHGIAETDMLAQKIQESHGCLAIDPRDTYGKYIKTHFGNDWNRVWSYLKDVMEVDLDVLDDLYPEHDKGGPRESRHYNKFIAMYLVYHHHKKCAEKPVNGQCFAYMSFW